IVPAARLGSGDHRDADPVLHRVERIEEFAFGQNVGLGTRLLRKTVNPDERGRADRLDDAVIDAAAEFRLLRPGLDRGIHINDLPSPRQSFRPAVRMLQSKTFGGWVNQLRVLGRLTSNFEVAEFGGAAGDAGAVSPAAQL